VEKWFVNITHVSASDLEFLGFTKTHENDEFIEYSHYTGDTHIVRKSNPYLFVNDINDAIVLGSSNVVNIK
jgi:hypothetical protein